MFRRTTLLLASLALAAIMAACQSAAPTSGPTGQPGSTASAPSNARASTSPATPASQPTSGGGGGGGGAVLPEGSWTAGTAHLVVSGDYSGTYDIPLSALSLTAGDTTLLNYINEQPPTSLTVSIAADTVSVVVTTGEFTGGAGVTQDSPCNATFSRSDA